MCRNCTSCTSCGGGGVLTREDFTPGRGGVIRASWVVADPDRRVVGTSAGAMQVPTARIVDTGPVLGYEQLFSEITPEGNASVYRNPGTFGQLRPVGRRL
jgi:hypothetical protein